MQPSRRVFAFQTLFLATFLPIPTRAAPLEPLLERMAPVLLGQTLPVPPGFVHGTKWGAPELGTGATVTWSFETTGGAGQQELDTFMPAGHEDLIRQAFQTWSDVANIQFIEVASGGQVKLFGRALGIAAESANAAYPGSGSSRILFNSSKAWNYDPVTGQNNIYQLTLHELGHVIGLRHPPGVIAAMDHAVSGAFQGLLPVDVAGAQAIYGPASGIDNSLYLPTNSTSFVVAPESTMTLTVNVGGTLELAETANITGALEARVEVGSAGDPSGIAFYSANLGIGDLVFSANDALATVDASFTGMVGDFFSSDWFGPAGHLTPISGGAFALDKTILGLVDGQVEYAISSPIPALNLAGLLSFYDENTLGAGPQSLSQRDNAALGSITGDGLNWILDIPLLATRTLDVPVSGTILPVTLTVTGNIHALAPVPEASPLVLAGLSTIFLAFAARRVRSTR